MPKKKPPAALSRDRPKLKLVKSQGKTAKGPIYQLKITLNNVKPPIWRRVLTKDCSLADLHNLIQVSMGWHDGHLHYFEVGGERFGLPEQWEQDFMDDDLPMNSCKVKLSQVIAQDFKKLKYLYDMGDGWDHTSPDRESRGCRVWRQVPQVHRRQAGLPTRRLRRAVGLRRLP